MLLGASVIISSAMGCFICLNFYVAHFWGEIKNVKIHGRFIIIDSIF